MSRPEPHDLGLHRVVEPEGVLPQTARRLDADAPRYANEIAIDVETLNIDSASFSQLERAAGGDPDAIARKIEEIVEERGKMQNPVTGSGGMLLGTVESIGEDYDGPVSLSEGDRIATLVSLTLTPLKIRSVHRVRPDADQVDVEATAYLWPSSPVVSLPIDLDERVALAALDVCGAPAQTKRLIDGADTVVILGAGKSGMLCAAAARRFRSMDIDIYGIDLTEPPLRELKSANLFDDYRTADAQKPTEVLDAVESMTGTTPVDLVINTCNVADTEMAAILPVRQGGTVYYFNMATDFAKAALGCEGVGRDAQLLIGNGYARGHAELTLELVRANGAVRRQLEKHVG